MRLSHVFLAALLGAGLVAVPQAQAAVTWVGPLSTRGRYIVDVNGDRFKLKSGNWHGASGTWNGSGDINDPANHHAGEKADQIPLGLDRASLDEIIDGFAELGINSVRLPFSNEMIHSTANEVRRTILDDPNWGWGDDHDWQQASRLVADRIQLEANPDLLIIIEGINWTGIPADGLPHGRPTLEPVRTLSHTLIDSGKLVYAAHFYGYTGPNHSGATGMGETHDPRYQDLSPQELRDVLYRQAFYVAAESGTHFNAPLWISEFGAGGRDNTDPKSRDWFNRFVDYLVQNDADFAFWPLVGFHTSRTGNGWALLHWDASGNRMGLYDGDDWREPAWTRLINAPSRTGRIPQAERWSMLSIDHGDFQQSRSLRTDWNPGARKAVCPDGQRVIGLSHTGNRGLCTGSWQSAGFTTVRDESYVDTDWASGYTKVQCPRDQFLAGYSVKGAAFDGALCAKSPSPLGRNGRTVWFDRGDNRSSGGGDFAYGNYKGQCATNEYIAGVAYTGRFGSSRTPDAILCRS
jgi:hypothetical protein